MRPFVVRELADNAKQVAEGLTTLLDDARDAMDAALNTLPQQQTVRLRGHFKIRCHSQLGG